MESNKSAPHNLLASQLNTANLVIFLVVLLSFSCKEDPFEGDSGTFTDIRDNHRYNWVKIGEQIWMSENLAYVPYACPLVSQCGIWVYGYNGFGSFYENYTSYGCLYDWKTAQEVCPDGWHLPSDVEWMIMEKFLGMKENALDRIACRGTDENIGGKLASTSNNYWGENFIRSNETGFTALPGGERNIRNFADHYYYQYINNIATFWTGSERDEIFAINRTIVNGGCIEKMHEYKNAGFSLRCVKN